jgi:hypothetical protein
VAGQRLGDGEALEWVVAEAFSTFSIDPDLVPPDDAPLEAERQQDVRADPGPPRGGCGRAAGALDAMIPVPVEEECEELAALLRELEDADAFELDRRLRRAVHLEQVLDATLAPILRRMREGGGDGGGPGSNQPAWRCARSSLPASTCEALGMSARKVRALLRIERAGDVCPSLRRAYRDGRLSWVKAQCLLPLLMLDWRDDGAAPDDAAPDEAAPAAGASAEGRSEIEGEWRAAWVGWAQRVTVRRLTEDVERALLLRAVQGRVWRQRRDHPETVLDPIPAGERQLCAPGAPRVDPGATERLAWWVPVEVALLFTGVRETLRRRLVAAAEAEIEIEVEAEAEAEPETETSAKTNERTPVSDGEVFEALLDEALRSWTLREPGARRPNPVIERDGYRCAVPGCSSRRNLQDHHIVFRSVGGSHAPWNRVTLCAFHHLRGVHSGRLGLRGQAPERLVFELGLRDRRDDRDDRNEERPALVTYRSGDVMMAS